MDESVQSKAAGIGSALASAGVTASEPSLADADRNKKSVEANVEAGVYFPIEPRHVENYDALVKGARAKGFEASVMLNTTSGSDDKGIVTLPISEKEAVVIVNEGSLKPTAALNTELTDHLLKKDRLIELSPEIAANYSELAGAAKGFTKPARVVLDKEGDDAAKAFVRVMQGTGGESIVAVNKNAVDYTEKFVKEFIQDSDVQMESRVHQGTLKDLTKEGMAQELNESMAASAAKRNLGDYDVYQDVKDTRKAIFTAAGMTEEGRQFIIVNKAFLDSPVGVQKAEMEHELAHLELGHETAKAIAERHNEGRLKAGGEMKLDQSMESAADKAAVREASNPAETARNFVQGLSLAAQQAVMEYKAIHTGATDKQAYKQLDASIADHPSLQKRIHDIQHYADHLDVPAPPSTPAAPQTPDTKGRMH